MGKSLLLFLLLSLVLPSCKNQSVKSPPAPAIVEHEVKLLADGKLRALDFLADIKHACGQNYVIGGPEEVFSIECSANKTVEFRPFDHAPFTYHTNHPMSNDDYNRNFPLMLKSQKNSLEQTEKDGFGC